MNLDDGEYVFWAEYTSESNDVYGRYNKIRQYVGNNRLIFRSKSHFPLRWMFGLKTIWQLLQVV